MRHNNDKFELVLGEGYNFGLFDPFFDPFFDMPMPRRVGKMEQAMKTDVKENENNYTLMVDLPGFDKKDISLNLNDGYLTISTKHEEKAEEKEHHNYVRRERFVGSVSRSFYVGDIEQNSIDAKLDNGVLTIVVPKQTKQLNSNKQIEIK